MYVLIFVLLRTLLIQGNANLFRFLDYMTVFIISSQYLSHYSLSMSYYDCFSLYRNYIGKLYTDSLVHDQKALKFLVDTIGEVL